MLSPSIPEMNGASAPPAQSMVTRLEARLSPTVCLLLWLALFHVLSVVYSPAARSPFIYDDLPNIVHNEDLRAEDALTRILGNHANSLQFDRRPVSGVVTWLNYRFGGLNVRGFRAVNTVIHWLCAGAGGTLIFLLARRLGSGAPRLAALSAALLWAVHPMNSTAVIYISQRQESLMTLFLLCSCLCLALSAGKPPAGERLWRALCLLCAFLSLFSKENAAGLPLLLLVMDCLLVSAAPWREVLARHRTFYELLALGWVAAFWWIMTGARPAEWNDGPALGAPWIYFKTQCRVVFEYFRRLVWPEPLVFAPQPRIAMGAGEWLPYGLALCALFGGWALLARRRPWLWLPWLAVLLVLGPTSSFIPVPLEPDFDYRMHLPALAVLATVLTLLWRGAIKSGGRAALSLALGFAGVAAFGLGTVTFHRARDYAAPESIWFDTIKKEPLNVKAWLNLTYHLSYRGHTDQAGRAAAEVLRISRDLKLTSLEADAHRALGYAAERKGEFARAGEEYRMAAELSPESTVPVTARGRALVRQGKHTEALALLDPLCAEHPEDMEAGLWRALALHALGRTAEAFAAAAPALALKAPPSEIADALAMWRTLFDAQSPPTAPKSGG